MSDYATTSGNVTAQRADDSRTFPREHLSRRIAELHPAYFALVMATGIVSMDGHLFGLPEVAGALFAINVTAYCTLLILYAVRASLFPQKFLADWSSHKRAFGFFTLIAATNVLGTQVNALTDNVALAQALWWVGFVLWGVCTYAIFVLLVVKAEKPSLEEGINGGWLISVVATQSICVLGCQVKPFILSSDFSAFLLLSFWLFGGMLYIWLISLIFYRYMFFRFEPSDLIPPYWINMGAMAITTLAGAEVAKCFGSVAPISGMIPFVKGLTAMYWATATWWIPMLLVLGFWRHGIRHFKFTYDPLYWGLVFPLGMYSVCTLKLGRVLDIAVMEHIARLFLVLGMTAWLITFLSMAQRPLFAGLLALRSVSRSSNKIVEEGCDGT
ncbi:MAG: tellurite resistance/C4-dicarboxylate transporter family protein [Candidatus Melainabacteria bacterium]|nr:tellurite resistance/C4-dicarboxylate transporter family protein [Candidatus Melainabacteria bacterium]